MELEELEKLEEELTERIGSDQRNWTVIYRLMSRVEIEKLWAARPETKSYTAWVNGLAARLHVHVSLLWSRLKAGRVYDEFYQRQEAAGRQAPPLGSEEAGRLAPDTINLCSTIAGKNADKMDTLLKSALAGNLSRADLRSSARAARAARKEAGEALPANGHNAIRASDREEGISASITAADILLALRQDHEWVAQSNSPYIERKYGVLDEFRADTGSSRHARRIDALVLESLSVSEMDTLRLHGVEIKVDVSDLKGDRKMAEYCPFVDYFYIAVPDNTKMIEAAEEVRLPDWGVLAVSQTGSVRVECAAKLALGLFRDKTMAAALIKLL